MLNRLHNAARLALVLGATWLLLVGPAALWQGGRGVEGLTWAAVICLLPGLFVVMRVGGPEQGPLAGMLVGTGLRLVAAIVSAVVLCFLRPDLRGEAFVVWLVPCYLAALAVETRLLLEEGEAWKSDSVAACRT